MERFFLDTNIFAYAFLEGPQPKRDRAVALIESAVSTRQGHTSAQVAHEFINLALRKFPNKVLEPDCLEMSTGAIKPLLATLDDGAVIDHAIQLHGLHRYSFYDCLVIASAIQHGATVLYTEDLHSGHRIGNLRIENPFSTEAQELPKGPVDPGQPPKA